MLDQLDQDVEATAKSDRAQLCGPLIAAVPFAPRIRKQGARSAVEPVASAKQPKSLVVQQERMI